MPSISTLAPWSFMLFSQTASVLLTVSPIIASRLTGPVWFVAQLVDHIHAPLVVLGLPLPLHVAHLDVGQFAVLSAPPAAICSSIDFFCASSWYQYPTLRAAARPRTAADLDQRRAEVADFEGRHANGCERFFFGFGAPSRLIRIIGFQSSSRPNPRPLPTGPRSARPAPPPRLPPEPPSSGTD